MAAVSDPLLGTQVGHYRLVRLIGEGGMGRVYAAVGAEGGREVAIKVVAETYARSPEISERFFAEAHAVNLIRHECIVDVIELSRLDDGRPVIVMELVEGVTLREIIRAGPIPLGNIVHIMIDVLAALTAAHAIGIIHRDLKPDNIMVTPSGRAKVLDFGIAKLTTPLAGVASPRTRTGVVLGTPHYMAPEQITGPGAEARSDVYSAGIVLYEAVTGRQPFTGATDFDVMRAQVEAEPRSPRSLRAEVPISVEQVILCALAKTCAARFSSAVAMANALRQVADELPVDQWQVLVGRTAATVNPGGSLVTRVDRPDAIGSSRRAENDGPEPERDVAATVRATPGARPTPVRATRARWAALAVVLVVGVGAALFAISRRPGTENLPAPGPPITAPIAAAPVVDAGADAISRDAAVANRSVDAAVTAKRHDAGGSHIARSADPDFDDDKPRMVTPNPTPKVDKPSGQFFIHFDDAFDPSAFIATARTLARKLEPDAELIEMKFTPVPRDGVLVLQTGNATIYRYRFRSAALGPAALLSEGNQCEVDVQILASRNVETTRTRDETCTEPFIGAPRCTLKAIWDKAVDKGADPATDARLIWNGRAWQFEGRLTNGHTQQFLFRDDCR